MVWRIIYIRVRVMVWKMYDIDGCCICKLTSVILRKHLMLSAVGARTGGAARVPA